MSFEAPPNSKAPKWSNWDPDSYASEHLPPDGDIAFAKCSELVDQHDKHMGDGWKDEIDTLMTFICFSLCQCDSWILSAGLFSAVITGFLTESYQWLQDDPASRTADTLAEILRI
ncbi:hypothetical protein FISHEDRAFT_48361, partial [Fistulina hepatica ATCC 64428]